MLPCRLLVFESGAGSKLVTARPSAMMQMFQVEGFDETAREVEASLRAIMEEAAG